MAKLRYRWGERQPQDRPFPARHATLALLVDDREVWQGDVAEVLAAWGRWCTLQMAVLWDCPDAVRRYLETGEAELQADAQLAATAAITASGPQALDDLGAELRTAARQAAALATGSCDTSPHAFTIDGQGNQIQNPQPWQTAQMVAVLALGPQHPHDGPYSADRQARQDTVNMQLRSLLLRHALPEHSHPLVDEPEHEAMLCDALLEAGR